MQFTDMFYFILHILNAIQVIHLIASSSADDTKVPLSRIQLGEKNGQGSFRLNFKVNYLN